MRALVLALLLGACSAEAPTPETTAPSVEDSHIDRALAQMPGWDQARAAGVDFRAVGQEPGWIADVYTQDRIRLLWDYGENIADFQLTEPSYPAEGAIRYETRSGGNALTINIRRHPCEDAMSGEAYPATVEITINGSTLSGCGRSP